MKNVNWLTVIVSVSASIITVSLITKIYCINLIDKLDKKTYKSINDIKNFIKNS